MDDLVQWLSEQLDIDATRAQETAAEYGAAWTAHPRTDSVSSDSGADVIDEPGVPVEFIAEHDPARVLREIDSKRAILALHTQSIRDGGCQVCDVPGGRRLRPDACTTVRMLASAHADRPGFRDEWRP